VIPANLIDAAFNSGVKAAQPPAPVPPQPVQPPQPPQPKPEPVKPPDPEPVKPAPTLVERVKEIFTPAPQKPLPDAPEPVEKPAKPKKVEISLKPVIRKSPTVTDTTAADEARDAKRERDARLKAIAKATRSIKENSSSATTVEMPGAGSVSYANYASVVKSVYEQAWTPPDDTSSDDANIKVSVTIGSDGTVITARVLDASGDARVDGSVQRTLDRVNFVAPFPDGAKEKQRTFIINFNLKAKRMLG
jgi:TonB family protein